MHMEPKIWGRYLWTSIHVIALGYPDNPSEQDKKDFKEFFANLWKTIPCQRCAENYKKHLNELPIDNALESNTTLFKWTVDLHNIVNKELHKPIITITQAEQLFARLARGDHSALGGVDKRWEQLALYVTYGIVSAILLCVLSWFVSKCYLSRL
jgi:hypothetical protein